MKILAVTDIHKDFDAARAAGMVESPDLVLDCGDHAQIHNLFEECPHYYIRGNHEPEMISFTKGEMPLPSYIPSGCIVEFNNGSNAVSFLGIDGNYGAKQGLLQVNPRIVQALQEIAPNTIDIVLLHESPLNVQKTSKEYQLASQVLSELDRLQPKLVLSGHTNITNETFYGKNKVKFVNLPDMSCGYGLIIIEGQELIYERKVARFGTKY